MGRSKLDACPFCGGDDIHIIQGDQLVEGSCLNYAIAECKDCRARGTPCADVSPLRARDAAVEAWNTRSRKVGADVR